MTNRSEEFKGKVKKITKKIRMVKWEYYKGKKNNEQ